MEDSTPSPRTEPGPRSLLVYRAKVSKLAAKQEQSAAYLETVHPAAAGIA